MGIDCPAVEHLAHNKDEDGVPTGHDLYAVKYTELIAVIVGAVQELSRKNDALETRMAELEAKIK